MEDFDDDALLALARSNDWGASQNASQKSQKRSAASDSDSSDDEPIAWSVRKKVASGASTVGRSASTSSACFASSASTSSTVGRSSSASTFPARSSSSKPPETEDDDRIGEIIEGLNPEQRTAATAPSGAPLLILAGAGSGKTLTLVRRVVCLVLRERRRAAAARESYRTVLALTFSRAAAREMKERLTQALGYGPQGYRVATFHAFALRLAREFAEEVLGRRHDFTLASRKESAERLAAHVMTEAAFWGGSEAPTHEKALKIAGGLLAAIAKLKTTGASAENASPAVRDAFAYHERENERLNTADMSDLVRWANEVAAAAGPELRSRHAHVLVDEFQDTSALQLSLATAVAPDGCVTVVGDDDQSIYGFQGAEVRNFQRFARGDAELAAVAGGAKRGARVVRLQRNYRSSSMIVEASCAVVRANKLRLKKEVFTTRDAGARVRVVSCRTTDVELDVVCAELRRALTAYGAAGGRGGAALDGPRVAVLYRTHNVGKTVRAALKKAKIPAYVCGLRQRQAVVLEVCGLLRCVANGRDDAAVERCVRALKVHGDEEPDDFVAQLRRRFPRGGLLDALRAAAAEAAATKGQKRRAKTLGRLPDAVDTLRCRVAELPLRGVLTRCLAYLPSANIADRLLEDEDNELVEYADAIDRGAVVDDDGGAAAAPREGRRASPSEEERFANLRLWIDRVVAALDEDGDLDQAPSAGRVFVGTIHQSKGREYDYVLVCRVNNDVLPHEVALKAKDPEPLEEERRVAYVAFSRAKAEMVVTYAERCGSQGLTPSMFLGDVPKHCVERRHVDDVAEYDAKPPLADRNSPAPPRKAPRYG